MPIWLQLIIELLDYPLLDEKNASLFSKKENC